MFRTLQRGAAALHLVLVAAVALGVFLQVYLIGAYVFGAGQAALDAHRTAGFTVHGLEVLVLVVALVAWLPRTDIILSAALAVLGTFQVALASETKWVGALHPLGALFVLVLAAVLLRRRRGAWTAGRTLRA
jgi:Family of unknown function (DUF6220)